MAVSAAAPGDREQLPAAGRLVVISREASACGNLPEPVRRADFGSIAFIAENPIARVRQKYG